ncbi:hypothetical protein SADUNF_Sadunf12G0098900 [Salix dunnii]|uniref:Pectinesterase inhibitor domain-containing protein n=1 Tax=Salix dunnii TaxID=1413687 RepID=A0A835MWA7_9ROSI|nr:hypothetical protein SADUNF_Sadunf12G0098900 [Salix dunnii]
MAARIASSLSSFNVVAFLLALLLCISTNVHISMADSTSKTYKNYLQKACNSTTYPQLCFSSLSSYTSTIKTSDLKLCNTALTVTLKAASNTSSLVKASSKQKGLSKSEAGAIKDCVDEMGDSIDELKQSLKALGSLKGSDMEFQIATIQTWAWLVLVVTETEISVENNHE